jgi:hypothetical protein
MVKHRVLYHIKAFSGDLRNLVPDPTAPRDQNSYPFLMEGMMILF